MPDENHNPEAPPSSQHLVVCYGSSLYLRGVALELAQLPDTLLIQMRTTRPDVSQSLHLLKPDLIVVDLVALEATAVLDLLRVHPTIPVVGLDILHNTVLMLSSTPLHVSTAQELLHSIQALSGGRPDTRGAHTWHH